MTQKGLQNFALHLLVFDVSFDDFWTEIKMLWVLNNFIESFFGVPH